MPQNILFTISLILIASLYVLGQNFPWERPLKIAWSTNGVNFEPPQIFQDSSGVPSVIRWKGDTLICAFQWFREPMNSPSWDRVAVKLSYDNGITWTQPTPIVVNGLPTRFQRPFDPTLVSFNNDSLRMYFSSSNGFPKMGLDSSVNTYSATSVDGINYIFEPGIRVDDPNNRVIDPAVIFYDDLWHFTAPIGSPQQGAYHFVSSNGLQFDSVPNIRSDNAHNWTGNLMINDSNELRFYGSSPSFIWYNSSLNAHTWNGFVNTNVQGGDPSVLEVAEHNYLMIFVGGKYSTANDDNLINKKELEIFPNPCRSLIFLNHNTTHFNHFKYRILSVEGKNVSQGYLTNGQLDVDNLSPGVYFIELESIILSKKIFILKFIKN